MFDLETTELIDEATPMAAMEVSVACAVHLPAGCKTVTGEGVQHSTHWPRTALFAGQRDHDENIEKLLEVFDSARVIVAYNGRDFDMQVLRRYYNGDEGRWEAHMRKLHDPMWAALSAGGGRRARLATLLAMNGLAGKRGTGCDAPALWHTGRLEQLERYCARDAEALAELVMMRAARVPGGSSTDRVGVTRWLAAGGDGLEHGKRKRDATAGGAEGTGGEEGERSGRRRRTVQYDETRRRQRKRPRDEGRHVDRSQHKQQRGSLKRGIEVGPCTMDRIVAGRYDWRDAGLRRVRARDDVWGGNKQWDPGGW